MYHVICCMKSKDSYNRIKSQYERKNVEWEDFIYDLDDIKSKFTVTDFDLAVIDTRLWWNDDAIEFFNRRNIQVVLFQGDFEEVLKQLYQICSLENDPEKEKVNIENQVLDSGTEIMPQIKEKIVEKSVRVEVPVYKSVYAGLTNQLILVANLSKRAGSTFLTLNLAKLLSNLKILTSVIEPPIDKPYIFDTVGLDVRIKKSNSTKESGFISFPHIIAENRTITRDKETIEDGILWLVADSRKPLIKSWDYYKMMKLIYASKKASINLVDCGSNLEHESLKPIISEADLVLVLVDPLPTECMQNEDLLNELFNMKKSGIPVEFVVNRWTSGVNKEELIDFLKVTPLATLPAIDLKYIHEAIYNYRIPFENKTVEETFSKPFYQIIKKFIPADMLKNFCSQKDVEIAKYSLFNNIFKRKVGQ